MKNAFTGKGYPYLIAKIGRQINWRKPKLIILVLFTKWSKTLGFLKHIYFISTMKWHFMLPVLRNLIPNAQNLYKNIRAKSLNGSNKHAFQL
jgi:hypothetical protein